MELNRQTVQSIHSEIQDLLAPLQEKYGITISLGNVRYDSSELRIKLTARVGKSSPRLSRNDFNVGDVVGIKSPKIDPNDDFEVIKINSKNIKVHKLGSVNRGIYNVSPGLLIKK